MDFLASSWIIQQFGEAGVESNIVQHINAAANNIILKICPLLPPRRLVSCIQTLLNWIQNPRDTWKPQVIPVPDNVTFTHQPLCAEIYVLFFRTLYWILSRPPATYNWSLWQDQLCTSCIFWCIEHFENPPKCAFHISATQGCTKDMLAFFPQLKHSRIVAKGWKSLKIFIQEFESSAS